MCNNQLHCLEFNKLIAKNRELYAYLFINIIFARATTLALKSLSLI